MSKRQPNKSSSNGLNFKSIWLDFSEKERQEIVGLIQDDTRSLEQMFEEAAQDGWKISVSYSVGWDNYIVSFTPKDVRGYPKNTTWIFRHSDFTRIVGVVRFFFGFMVPNGDSRLRDAGGDNDW